MGIPAGAAAALDRYLDAVDDAIPGLLVGLHAVGSLALGDYHPERSDIDVVAVVDHAIDASERSLLTEIHRVVATRVDGPYVPLDRMLGPPEAVGPVAFHVDGRFEVGECHEVSPITWSILANDAITVRGKSPVELGVHADADAVRAFSAVNLREYWAGWARTIASLLDGTADDDVIEARMLEWGVLGVSRVHCAATTGRVIAKRAAADYALETFAPEWNDIVHLAIATRDGEIDQVRVASLRRACAFIVSTVEQ